MTANQDSAQDEVVGICRDLIRIDTTNPGDHSGPGERQAAEYVAALLADVDLEPQVLESHPKRARTRTGPPSSSTATSTSSRPTPPTGSTTPSRVT
jgi:acetylornithine deacetylase/succinyl-diaminopimelate desuccinylase-like protein